MNIILQRQRMYQLVLIFIKLTLDVSQSTKGTSLRSDIIQTRRIQFNNIKVLQTAINLDYKKGIAVDGIWGVGSKAALGNHYVRKGETQYMVTALQILLMLKGYACVLTNPGVFDANLEAVVKRYQSDYQLTVDGVVGYNTWMSLIH